MQITVGQYLLRFLLAKWAGAFVMGLWVMLAALIAKRAATGWIGALALPWWMSGRTNPSQNTRNLCHS